MESLVLNSHKFENYTSMGNSVGIIVDNKLIIYQHDTMGVTKIEDLSKVSFHKRRNYFLNFIASVLGSACGLTILNTHTGSLVHMILLGIFICTVILVFSIKSMCYTLVVLRFNLTFTAVKVRKHQVNDAETLVEQINEKLQERKESLRQSLFR